MANTAYAVRAGYFPLAIDYLPAPYNQAQLKIHYPADQRPDAQQRDSGIIPPLRLAGGMPMVIFMAGANCHAEAYNWLGQALASRGIAMLSYSYIGTDVGSEAALTPGIELAQMRPDNFAKAPSALLLPAILQQLQQLNCSPAFADCFDLHQLILGGHSAGGTLALLNAVPDWFAGIKACFSYAAHTAAATVLGWPQQTLLPLPAKVPTLMLGGSRDGVIANSAERYQADADPTALLQRCFQQANDSDRDDNYLAIVEGANHGTVLAPEDPCSGRGFLDWPAQGNSEQQRQLIADLCSYFIAAHVQQQPTAVQQLRQLLEPGNQLLSLSARK